MSSMFRPTAGIRQGREPVVQLELRQLDGHGLLFGVGRAHHFPRRRQTGTPIGTCFVAAPDRRLAKPAMSTTIPTTASQMISFDALALEAGAGAEILQYLDAKRIGKVATLALVAVDQASFERFVIQPLLDGVEINGVKHQLSPDDGPVGTAVLLHMWLEARRQWTAFSAASATPPPTGPQPPSGTPQPSAPQGLSAVDGGDERAPKTFPQWRQQIERYNEVLLGGRRRRFPERQLMGAEAVLARLWHEHTRTKLYTPLGLGEILARRTFTASGELNPLVLGKNSSTASSNQALRLLGQEFVPADDPQWVPRSLMALLDGIEASKWAWILVGLGDEDHIIAFTDWFVGRLRSRPTLIDAHRDYWLMCGWRIAMDMRVGATFADAAETVMTDHAAYQEAMAAAAGPARKRPNSATDTTGQQHPPEAPGAADDEAPAKTPRRPRRRAKRKAQPTKTEDSKQTGKETDKSKDQRWWSTNDGKSTGWNTWRKTDAKR